ncbi:beta-glucosidase [Sphingobium sp. B7D2B]|uniref:glycoside hydrolase family 3 protein n=1 Tax=Sphingobium sp. B7D2B TaxID=2940583 RepID=UPI0022259369|nr:glycoside hydrolase family 3 N-terminal domain-containing protein [Sphingobium sp. B7D2B]MCW2365158.1 beta-glucosidase [Sphingobium sp. B7D2B]
MGGSGIMLRSASLCALAVMMSGCTGLQAAVGSSSASTTAQPDIAARTKPILTLNGLRFKDLNGSGTLEPYEDWRLPANMRANDLVKRMTLAEKAGTMLIATQNPDCDGSITADGRALIQQEHMSRFILRATVATEPADCSVRLTGFRLRGGYRQTPLQMARFTNAVQEMREASRLGIPALFKDNARNHVEVSPTFGIGQGAGAFTEFPKEAGLAAAALGAAAPLSAADGAPPANLRGDMSVIAGFTRFMGQEWRAIGLRGMYGYMADLGTEPRWSRFHETFSEDADLVGDIVTALVKGLQGEKGQGGLALSPATAVSMTLKHFPGGGPQQLGLDAHYTFGKDQFYTDPSGRYGFDYHLRPFQRAIDVGVGSIMPYYGVPVDAHHGGRAVESLGMAFSRHIVTGILRDELGFRGYVNSDSGIIEERGWGLEDSRTNPATGKGYTVADRTALAIRAGTDILSEFRSKSTIVDLVAQGALSEAGDIDPAVKRLLTEQFALGLFENPYVDAEAAPEMIGTAEHRALGLDIQRRSLVLLHNQKVYGSAVLPLRPGSRIYTMGFAGADFAARGFAATDGNYDVKKGQARPAVPAGTDYAVINVRVSMDGARRYSSKSTEAGGRAVDPAISIANRVTGKRQASWGEQDPCTAPGVSKDVTCVDDNLIFGGAFPWEAGMLSFSAMAKAQSWSVYPSLADIQAVMREIGDPRRVILNIYFRQPYVLDEASGLRNAGAIIASFGASDAAQIDVLTGKQAPAGRLPFALPASLDAVDRQHSDAPGYAETPGGTLYPFGFGLTY